MFPTGWLSAQMCTDRGPPQECMDKMSPPGWDRMTPSAAVKSRAEATRRQLVTLSRHERMKLQRRRRQRQALYRLCVSTVYALVLLLVLYAAVRVI
jgi:hypothetical protein